MKKIISGLLILATILTTMAFATNNEPSVYLNGEKMTFDVNPYIENDRTLVPMRAIFEAVGATVQWDETDQTVYAIRNKNNVVSLITLQVGNDKGFVNAVAKDLDTPAVIKNDRTFVPLRFVIEALGEKVEWDNENYAVMITTTE